MSKYYSFPPREQPLEPLPPLRLEQDTDQEASSIFHALLILCLDSTWAFLRQQQEKQQCDPRLGSKSLSCISKQAQRVSQRWLTS